MLTRVRRLEAGRARVPSPFEAEFGSLDGFETHCRAGVREGTYDATDMRAVMLSVRRWHNGRV